MHPSVRRAILSAVAAGLLLALAGVTLSACNTVEGAGKDLEKAGDAIGDFARSTKKKIEE
jgi:entericidin B